MVVGAPYIFHDLWHRFPQSLVHRLVSHFYCGKLPAFTLPLLIGNFFLNTEKTHTEEGWG